MIILVLQPDMKSRFIIILCGLSSIFSTELHILSESMIGDFYLSLILIDYFWLILTLSVSLSMKIGMKACIPLVYLLSITLNYYLYRYATSSEDFLYDNYLIINRILFETIILLCIDNRTVREVPKILKSLYLKTTNQMKNLHKLMRGILC